MHRETLEIRLATEELWIKLSGAVPPAALTHSLGRIRNRLADQYRLANAELLEQKKELESIRDQLVEQYQKLVEQKQQFERWMDARQEESQQQASMLIAREQAILQQQTHFEEQSQAMAHRADAIRAGNPPPAPGTRPAKRRNRKRIMLRFSGWLIF